MKSIKATQMRVRYLLCLVLVAGVSAAYAQRAVPELWGLHVHDESHVLSTEAIDRLEHQLDVYEDSTSNQIAVLIIPSLDGDVLEQYSLRVAEAWRLGQSDKDNGALLLIALNDRKMRIEVGQGLEGPLTDAVCSRIIRNEIAPPFRQSNYDDGITAGINAMISAIGGEYTAADADADGNADFTLKEKVLIGLFLFVVLGIFTVIGILAPGCAGWFLYAFLIPFYALFPMMIVGTGGGLAILITYLIVFPLLKFLLPKTAWGGRLTKKLSSSGKSRGGRWSGGSGWGGWSSGSGGGGSSGGGGFSGGGGSFGGGGSSGSW
ncbi:TPM domain-containing protein [Chryseolinea sp. T2]|uniref:TPM domain-containing protein n=1 Tax=Chryseolinea sp. T2 TaxID=3129255 RepID=UPI003077D31B